MSGKYIISKGIDPIFAVSCGVIAAAVRINREEKEKGKTTQESVDSFKRRWALVFEKEAAPAVDSKQAG